MTYRRLLRPAAASLLAILLCTGLATSPAQAQGYEGLIEAQPGFDAPLRGNADGGGYSGLVGWDASPNASNPYGNTRNTDIYQFVRGAGTTFDERKEQARQEREAQKKERQEQARQRNLQRVEELQRKLQQTGMERQKRIQEQHAEIMQRMKLQQQQQQQQQKSQKQQSR